MLRLRIARAPLDDRLAFVDGLGDDATLAICPPAPADDDISVTW
jgi:hypothetical protein